MNMLFNFHFKFFCPKCRTILWFWDVRCLDDTRVAWYKCCNCGHGNDTPELDGSNAVLPLKWAMKKMLINSVK